MNPLTLPEPINAYFEADTHDGLAVARCFTADGRVLDEGQTHTGHPAIEAWTSDTTSRYRYRATPFKVYRDDRRYIVTSHIAGDFPGSPVDLRYAFTLECGRIATLEITP